MRRDDDEERKREQEQQMKSHHYLKIHDESDVTVSLHDDDDRADILENDTGAATNFVMDSTWNQLDKDSNNDNERLSTIYESPIATPTIEEHEKEEEEEEDIYDDAFDKLVVYDIAKAPSIEKVRNIKHLLENTQLDYVYLRIPCSVQRQHLLRIHPFEFHHHLHIHLLFLIELVFVLAIPKQHWHYRHRLVISFRLQTCVEQRP